MDALVLANGQDEEVVYSKTTAMQVNVIGFFETFVIFLVQYYAIILWLWLRLEFVNSFMLALLSPIVM